MEINGSTDTQGASDLSRNFSHPILPNPKDVETFYCIPIRKKREARKNAASRTLSRFFTAKPIRITGTDHLSRLPVELLDLILVLAWTNSELTTRPISKYLLLSQERAIYKTVIVESKETFGRLLRTLKARPQKGRHTSKLVWKHVPFRKDDPINRGDLLRYLTNLVELEVSFLESTVDFLKRPELVTSLRIFRLSKTSLNSSIMECLSRIPTLRRVEVDWNTFQAIEGEEAQWTLARQVRQVGILSMYTPQTPSRLLRIFPSAHISCLHASKDNYTSTLPFFDAIDHQLLSLRLTSTSGRTYFRNDTIDHLFPEYQNLQHLHLDFPFYSESFQTHLLTLSNLVSLSLTFYKQALNLDKIFERSDRLPHLRTLNFAYLLDEPGFEFDFPAAYEQRNNPTPSLGYDPFSLLQGVTNLAQMTDWNCPGNRTISDLIREAKEMVEKAESIGLVVQSNLSELIRVFRLQIVECYNRAVGDLYFHELTEPLEYALCLAEKYGLDINLVKIKAGREFQVDDLEWFEDEREDEMMPSCRLYGLRLRGSNSESESDSESEMESEVESESELGSESGVEEDEEGDEDEGEEEEEEVSVGSGQASGESEVD